jgi:hypothetical protein
MHRTLAFLVMPCIAALTAGAAAQSPLTTTFVSSTFLAATTGVTVYFDLAVNTAVDVNRIDANFYGAAGPQVRLEVWGRNGTHIGNNSSNSGWTLLGVSSTVSSSGRDVPTQCPFPTPFRLLPGINGIAVQHFGAGAAYTAGTGVGQPFASTAEMTLLQGGSSNPPIFVGTQNAPRVMNCSIHYTPVGGFATASTYGQGCGGIAQYQSWYENFPAQTFDLGGTATTTRSILHVATATGYVVVPGTGQWFTPTSAALPLANDSVSGPHALGFTFAMPNAAPTPSVWVADDGYLWLQAGGIADFTPAVNELLTQGARMAPLWLSMNPSGGIHFDLDPLGNVAYVTWLNVPATGAAGAAITMQVALFANGDFEFRYGPETVSTAGNTFALAGVSTGGGVLDPGNRDVSATLPFTLGPDLQVPNVAHAASARPVLGSTIQLQTTNAPAAAIVGLTFLSVTKIDPGIDLTALGMPGCRLYQNLDVALTTPLAAGSGSQPFPIPSSLALIGFLVATQAGVLHPPANALGLLSSNGVELRLDAF